MLENFYQKFSKQAHDMGHQETKYNQTNIVCWGITVNQIDNLY